jgi:hypothetical protein
MFTRIDPNDPESLHKILRGGADMRVPRVWFTEGLLKSRFDRFRPFLIGLAASALLAAVLGHRTELTRDGPTEGERQAARDDDHRILEVALLDPIDFEEAHILGRGKKTTIVLSEETIGSSFYLSDGQLDGESHDGKKYLVPVDIREDLRRRNPEEPVSMRGFKPSSSKILVRDLKGLKVDGEFEKEHPNSVGCVEAWLPGYSKDGQTAVLRASFGPTPHGATTTYMLAKKNGRWSVVWRKVAYYA